MSAFGLAAAAHAASASSDLTVSVVPTPGTIAAVPTTLPSGTLVPAGETIGTASIGRAGLDTYLAYQVTVSNISNRSINHVRFRAAPAVFDPSGTPPAPQAIFFRANGVTCAPDAATSFVDCEIGKLFASGQGVSSKSFTLVYLAPPAGAQLDLAWKAYFSEGTSDNEDNAARIDTVKGTAYARLITATAQEVRTGLTTYVPLTGGRFFTGLGAVATATDPVTTTVIVPPGLATTAQISEIEPLVVPCTVGACFESRLTLPGSFDALTILLRRDNTTIPKGLRARDVVVFYVADAGPNAGVPIQLQRCSKRSPPGPAPHEPCIVRVTRFSATNAPGPEWVRDKEIEIRALDNGRYIN